MRYLPLTAEDRRDMLARIGATSVDALFRDVPADKLLARPVELPPHQGEIEVERALATMAAKNLAAGSSPFFCGAGAYRHHIPAAVDHLIQRSEFLTSYTPYQPEISQGTLQYLFEFQTQIALISGMEIANASMYDGSTAAAEAVLMAARLTRRNKAVLSGGLHPQYRAVIATSAAPSGLALENAPWDVGGVETLATRLDASVACVVVQNPSFFGYVRDFTTLAEACRKAGALLVMVTSEIVSLGAIKSPGEMGADIFVGEGQSLGNPLGFGGPYLGLLATREKNIRQMPGRVAGETVDADGRRGYVLTLSTREQHIRREKATSNICTNSGLCALAFCIHMTLLGEEGFTRLARLNHAKAVRLAERLGHVRGVKLQNDSFFNEFTVRTSKPASEVVSALAKRKILGGVPVSRLIPGDKTLADMLLLAATETTTDADIEALVSALQEIL
ncbi:MAG: aminomethyl-transferring glycine dehydrogenase subunit GcvPA [Alphaproteobacteria bacterium]|nr:aminomethyl-transferring glycine dehydrogenase subunit GcvPA [Alphaproteobacteria bacterium]